jgi:hypothetical protein
MATKEENKATLERLQRIPREKLRLYSRWGGSGDDVVEQVIAKLRTTLDEVDTPRTKRAEKTGYDRLVRRGHDREG